MILDSYWFYFLNVWYQVQSKDEDIILITALEGMTYFKTLLYRRKSARILKKRPNKLIFKMWWSKFETVTALNSTREVFKFKLSLYREQYKSTVWDFVPYKFVAEKVDLSLQNFSIYTTFNWSWYSVNITLTCCMWWFKRYPFLHVKTINS